MTTETTNDSRWEILVQGVLAAYPEATKEGPKALRLVLASDANPNVRIGLRLRLLNAYGNDVVVIAADLGPATGIDPFDALLANSLLVYGSLAAESNVLVLRSLAFVDELTTAELLHRFRLVAAEALELKLRLQRPHVETSAYAHFAD